MFPNHRMHSDRARTVDFSYGVLNINVLPFEILCGISARQVMRERYVLGSRFYGGKE